MPCPYNIIFGRDMALPSPLYHSGVTGIDIISNKQRFTVEMLRPYKYIYKQVIN